MKEREASSTNSGALSNPLSFLNSGSFGGNSATLSGRGGFGYYWLLRSVSTAYSYYFVFYATGLYPQGNNALYGNGYAVRCVGLAPDSICPKGWQLPTFDGDKSFTTLMNTSYSMKNYNQTSEDNQDSGVLSNPLSFIRNGLYYWDGGLGPRGQGFAVRGLGLAPDSICPKGWQLPTYSGDKSFTTLINTSYSMKNTGQTEENSRDSGLLSNPLSFLRSGYFYWNNASLDYRGSYGYYWSLRSANTTYSVSLIFSTTGLLPQHYDNLGFGFAVRCVAASVGSFVIE